MIHSYTRHIALAAFALTLFMPTFADSNNGMTPQNGTSCYFYNNTEGMYLAVKDGKLTLSDMGTPVTLSQTDNDAMTGSFTLSMGGKVLATAFQHGLTLNDSSTGGSRWMFKPTADGNGTYAIGCRDNTAGAMAYIYYSRTSKALTKLYAEPSLGGLWTLQAQNNIIVTLDETTPYSAPTLSDGTTATVHLKRTFTLNAWNTLCLPFGITLEQLKQQLGNDTKVGEYVGFDNGTLQFNYVTDVLLPGVPYLIKPTKAPESMASYYTFTNISAFAASEKPTEHNGVIYTGLFSPGIAPARAYALSKNKVYHLTSDMTIKGFRGYFAQTDPTASPVLTWSINDTPTDISTILSNATPADIYDTTGRLVKRNAWSAHGLTRGTYIVNGKKFIVK